MARDLVKAAERFLRGTRQVAQGLELQRSRVVERHENGRELLPGNPIQVRLLEGPDNDLHYYAFEVERLRHIAIASAKVFKAEEITEQLRQLDAAIPGLKRVRDALTHFNDEPFLDDVLLFSSIVKTGDRPGSTTTLVDPRYQHHDAAMALATFLSSYFSSRIQQAHRDDPGTSIDKQIEARNLVNPRPEVPIEIGDDLLWLLGD